MVSATRVIQTIVEAIEAAMVSANAAKQGSDLSQQGDKKARALESSDDSNDNYDDNNVANAYLSAHRLIQWDIESVKGAEAVLEAAEQMSGLSQQDDEKAKPPFMEKMQRSPSYQGNDDNVNKSTNSTNQRDVFDMEYMDASGSGSVAESSDDSKEDSNVRGIFHMDNIEDYDVLAIRDNEDFTDAVQERVLNCFMTVSDANKVLAERGIPISYSTDVSYDFEEIMSETEAQEIEYVD